MGKGSKALVFTALLLAVISCKTGTTNLKPDPEPEAFNLPPESDQRFSKHIVYPSETLHDDPLKKSRAAAGQQPPGMAPGRPSNMGMMR